MEYRGGMAIARPRPSPDTLVPVGRDSREPHRRVLDAAVEAGDLATTLAAVAGLTRSTAVLQDPFLAVLASGQPEPGAGEAVEVDGVALTRSGSLVVRNVLRAGSPALVELPRVGATPPRLVARLTARGELLGFLVVAAVDRNAYSTVETAGPVVTLLLQAEERLCRLLARDQRELFLDLLGGGRSAEALVIQGRRLGHDLDQPHWPLAFRAEGAGLASDRLESVLAEALRGDPPGGRPAPVVGVDGDAVIVFLPARGAAPGAIAERVRTSAARRGLRVAAGWGPRCEDLDSFATGAARARWVVEVLAGMPGDAAPAGYDDLGIYALLYEKRDQDQLADFAERWLGPLRAQAELATTLRVLLETGGPSAAAGALFVHISTLKYRLRKIESILGVDLSDPEVCFNLRLAFKILAVRERLAGGPA